MNQMIPGHMILPCPAPLCECEVVVQETAQHPRLLSSPAAAWTRFDASCSACQVRPQRSCIMPCRRCGLPRYRIALADNYNGIGQDRSACHTSRLHR